jgi:hypothetical protein
MWFDLEDWPITAGLHYFTDYSDANYKFPHLLPWN